MANKKLKSFVHFIPGINQTRAENYFSAQDIQYYDQASFESDFYFDNNSIVSGIDIQCNKACLCVGDIVVSNIKQRAAIVGPSNAGKMLPMNFTKVEFLNELMDRNYFLFLFNISRQVQRQKERETQGNGVMQKIPLRALGELLVPCISIEQQVLVGKSYVEMLQIQNKLKKLSDLTELLTYSALEEIIKEAK